MPTPSGRVSMMDAILAGERVSMGIVNKGAGFDSPVLSMVDGKHYTSRHAYDQHLKDNNCEIVGNDWKSKTDKVKDYGNDVELFDKKRETVIDTIDGI